MAKTNGGGWLKSKDQINGLLDRGCSFDGKIVFDGTVQINGEFTGEIISEGTLVIGQEARVSGTLKVDTLVCYGTVSGRVEAKNRIEIHVPSVVTADISTKSLVIEDGSLFQGNCNMHHADDKPGEISEQQSSSINGGDTAHPESVVM